MQQGEGTSEGRRRPSPAMVVAVAALIAALAGTAVAVDKIRSKDIAPNAVRSKHIKAGQVKSKDADLVKHRRAGALSTAPASGRANAGPAISVRAKAGDLLHVMAQVTIRRTAGTGHCWVSVGVEGGGNDDLPADAMRDDDPTPTTRYFSPFDTFGTTLRGFAAGRTIPVSQTGTYRISLSYYADLDDTGCAYSDRNLWVEHVR